MALEQPTTTPTTACQPAALVRLIELIDAAVPLRGRELLDIGCGDGRFTAAVANRFDHVHAVDCDHAALGSFGASNRSENVAVELMSVLDLSFPDGTFDRVTAIDLFEELHRDANHVDGLGQGDPAGEVLGHEFEGLGVTCIGSVATVSLHEIEFNEEFRSVTRMAADIDVTCQPGRSPVRLLVRYYSDYPLPP